MRLDSGPVFSPSAYKANATTPVVRHGRLNPSAVRQISSGSILGVLTMEMHQAYFNADKEAGLCAGLAVSTFSRSLVIILGLLAFGVQVRHEDDGAWARMLTEVVGRELPRNTHHSI